MIIDRSIQRRFIQDELRYQTEEFKQKLESTAVDLLLDKHELYVAQFVKFSEKDEMILKFSSLRPMPRKNEHLYAFTLPETLRRYKEWGNLTYGDLIKKETKATEVKCIWHQTTENSKFNIAGFRGITEEFKKYVENAPGGIITLGPQVPPYEYLANLEKVSFSQHHFASEILDIDFQSNEWTPVLLNSDTDMSTIFIEELNNCNTIILQGPPGTGKTYRIARLCEKLCAERKTVLVTALTNRALMELADNLKESYLLNEERIYKTNLTTDEARECSGIQNADSVKAIPGNLMLSTFYISSGVGVRNYEGPIFDYVIVDEASQAFLAMLAIANMIGHKNIWVGDVHQMPPIAKTPKDKVKKLGYSPLINGFDALTTSNKFKTYQLTDTYRLGPRAAKYTGTFYNGTLKSKIEKSTDLIDGPIMKVVDMPIGDLMPAKAISYAVSIAKNLLQKDKKLEIAILSQRIKTTQALQTEAARQLGAINNVLVDTVARVQGITKDYTIYFITDTDDMLHSLELRLFNVATSRAKRNTFIVCPSHTKDYFLMTPEVREYLNTLYEDSETSSAFE